MKKTTLIITILLAAGLTSSHAQDTWTQKADFEGTARHSAAGFSIGSKGYVGTGYNGNYKKDFWEYDPATNAWTQKADFGGAGRAWAIAFSIGSKGFIGIGFSYEGSSHYYNDFWEYDPNTNIWIQKANFAGIGGPGATGFSIGSKGYISCGNGTTDFWEYDPWINIWTQKANFGGTAREYAVGFSIDSKGYIGTGVDAFSPPYFKGDFWEYDPATNSWTQKANFGGTARYFACGFSIGNKGYIGTGADSIGATKDFWEYDPAANGWTQREDFEGGAISNAVAFSTGDKGYIVNSISGLSPNEFWEYAPCVNGSNVYADADGDGYGNAANSIFVMDCITPSGYVKNSTDCNDDDASIHPGACDAANGNNIDDNCDGIIDDGYGATTYYIDADGDGYGAGSGTSLCSKPGSGFSTNNTDCNDADGSINPGAIEIINGVDDNCNGLVDDYCIVPVNLSVKHITGTSAKLKWDSVAAAEGYKVRYKVANTSIWKNRTTYNNSKPISDLLPNSIYIWEVQTFCQIAPNVISAWSSKQEFTTGSLRVSDKEIMSFELYPNPVYANFTIDLQLNTGIDESADIFLLNALGQIIYTSHEVVSGELKKEITMPSSASSGLYILRVVLSNRVTEKKLLYEK